MQANVLLEKYGGIIAEEVNVKEVSLLDEQVVVTVTYAPLGQKLGALFGKDTSQIIAAAKEGHATLQSDGTLVVQGTQQTRTLTPDMYEIRYSGLEEDYQTVEGGVIVSLDFTLTEALKKEGIAREISRFLNQLRKDLQFQIDQKIHATYMTNNTVMQEVVQEFTALLQDEALLATLKSGNIEAGTLGSSVFSSEEGEISFLLTA